MLPLINILPPPIQAQPSLVSTAIPENNTLRVPHDNVAPPVSSVGVDPNARGNNQFPVQQAPSPLPTQEAALPSSITGTSLSPGQPLGAPATLLAQFMGQRNLPPEVQNVLRGVLGEYEKLVVNSYVKHMPSNATLPRSEPANLFTEIINQNTATAKQTASTPAAASPATQPAVRPAATTSRNNEFSSENASDRELPDEAPDTPPSASIPASRVIQAYQMSASRIQKAVESVEEADTAS